LIKRFTAGAVITLVALSGTQAMTQSASAAKRYSSPCEGVRNCQAGFQDGEGWMVITPKKNWKKAIYRFKRLKKSAKRVCPHVYPKLTMHLNNPRSTRHRAVTIKASGKLPRSECFT
jgi:hypothetical protein